MSDTILECRNLKKYFDTPYGQLHAVDGISFSIGKGKTLGVVGESGCGKSTLGRTILNLLPATAGEILFEDRDLRTLGRDEMLAMRKRMQIIFQDPYSSIDPRMTVSEIIAEPLVIHGVFKKRADRDARVRQLMDLVGIADRYASTYPHEMDGGRRQRVSIARALALDPRFIVCDEPVSALDVSIQAQILNLMMDLQDRFGFTYMFITHSLSVVKHISDEIAVLYLGQMVEKADPDELFARPLHPYTKALLAAIPEPTLESRNRNSQLIRGEVTSPVEPKPGCRFAARCPEAMPRCHEKDPELIDTGGNHLVACYLAERK